MLKLGESMEKIRYKLFILLTLFLLPEVAQPFQGYNYMLKTYLSPPIDTTTTKEIASFIGITVPMRRTPFIPEHSIRIIKSGNHFSIEARIFGENLSKIKNEYEISVLDGKDTKFYPIEIFTSIMPISDSLKDRMLSIFYKVISYGHVKPSRIVNADGSITLSIYEGPTYEFVINDSVHSQSTIGFSLDPTDSTDLRNKVIKTNLQIVNDLKNNIFDESKYDIYK
jgi:hypothetical protein